MPIFVKFIEQLHPNPRSILDVGCGPLREAFRLHYGNKYKGLDLADSGYPKDYIGDAHNMPKFKDEEFDIVTAWSVLEHLESPLTALREMLRVSRFIVILSTDHTQQDKDNDPTHLYCWTPKVFGQFLARAGGHHVHVWEESSILFGMVKR